MCRAKKTKHLCDFEINRNQRRSACRFGSLRTGYCAASATSHTLLFRSRLSLPRTTRGQRRKMSLSACRHAMRHRSGIALLQSSSAASAKLLVTPTAAGIGRCLHRTPARWQQGAAAGAGEEGWTGGDGSDGHAGARVLGIVFFSSLVGCSSLVPCSAL